MRQDGAIAIPALTRTIAVLLALGLLGSGCGGGDDEQDEREAPPAERADPPAKPPAGWRTVRNVQAGFTIAAPIPWSASTSGGRTTVRSDDRLVAVAVSADRTSRGRQLSPAQYARRTIRTVPDFAGTVDGRVSRVPGSRYPSAVLTATGTVSPSNLSQRISVVIFQRPGRVIYGLLVFRNAGVKPRFNDRIISRMLRTFRAQPGSR